jgi:hypothetical protein
MSPKQHESACLVLPEMGRQPKPLIVGGGAKRRDQKLVGCLCPAVNSGTFSNVTRRCALSRYIMRLKVALAEFYAGSSNDCRRALDLARINVENRPTLRALEHAH